MEMSAAAGAIITSLCAIIFFTAEVLAPQPPHFSDPSCSIFAVYEHG